MSRSRVPSVATVVLLIAGAVWLHGQPHRGAGSLTPQDIFEIEMVVQGYQHGIDIGPEDSSWVFTPDATFEYLVGPTKREVKGQKALKEFYANLRKQNTTRTIRHVLSNLIIRPAPGGATGSVYNTTIEAPLTITAIGMYEDQYVKTAEGWRIKHRFYHQDLPANAK